MTIRDVLLIDRDFIGPEQLFIDDLFIEDCYPEVHRVVRFDFIPNFYGTSVVVAINTETNEETVWAGSGAYAPCLIRVKPKDKQ